MRTLTLLLSISALITLRSVQAATITIDLTEISSTDLESSSPFVTSIQNTGIHQWTVNLSDPTALAYTPTAWVDPEDAATGNVLSFGPGQFFVNSDMITVLPQNANGSQVDIPGQIGPPTDISPADFLVTFTDDAVDGPVSAPDTGSTFGLLFISLLALFSTNRIRISPNGL